MKVKLRIARTIFDRFGSETLESTGFKTWYTANKSWLQVRDRERVGRAWEGGDRRPTTGACWRPHTGACCPALSSRAPFDSSFSSQT